MPHRVLFVIALTFTACSGPSTGEAGNAGRADLGLPDAGSQIEDAGSEADAGTASRRVKIFILSGQSNMVGQGTVEPTQQHLDRNGGRGTLRNLVSSEDTAARYQRYTSGTEWTSRDDVWLIDLDTSGPLTVIGRTFGPEVGFGHTIGDFYEAPVVLIKVAWGGRSLYGDFRPPSASGDTGETYTDMVARVHEVLDSLATYYPAYDGQGYDLLGFAWHQGWNDRVSSEHNAEYQETCVHFINDARAEFGVDDLPFVLAITGMGGWEESHPRALSLMNAQLAVPTDAGLANPSGVSAVETRDFWRTAEDSPADENYHWNRNAESYVLVGESLGAAMIDLLD